MVGKPKVPAIPPTAAEVVRVIEEASRLLDAGRGLPAGFQSSGLTVAQFKLMATEQNSHLQEMLRALEVFEEHKAEKSSDVERCFVGFLDLILKESLRHREQEARAINISLAYEWFGQHYNSASASVISKTSDGRARAGPLTPTGGRSPGLGAQRLSSLHARKAGLEFSNRATPQPILPLDPNDLPQKPLPALRLSAWPPPPRDEKLPPPPPPLQVEESRVLSRYKTRDLRLAYMRRAGYSEEYIRTELQRERAEAAAATASAVAAKGPTGFLYYEPDGDSLVEAKMEALWLRKQEERLVDAAEAKAVHCKLQSWATGRARREAELSRKIEASRFGVHGASFFAETGRAFSEDVARARAAYAHSMASAQTGVVSSVEVEEDQDDETDVEEDDASTVLSTDDLRTALPGRPQSARPPSARRPLSGKRPTSASGELFRFGTHRPISAKLRPAVRAAPAPPEPADGSAGTDELLQTSHPFVVPKAALAGGGSAGAHGLAAGTVRPSSAQPISATSRERAWRPQSAGGGLGGGAKWERPAALPLSLRAPSATEQWASAWPAAPAAESPSDGSSGSSDEEDTAGAEADGAATAATTEAEEQAYKLLEKQTRAFTNVRLQALGGEVANFGVGRPHSASLPSSMGFGSTHAESLMEMERVKESFARHHIKVSLAVLEKALTVPQDLSYVQCLANLPKPMSRFRSHEPPGEEKPKKGKKKGAKKKGAKGTKKKK